MQEQTRLALDGSWLITAHGKTYRPWPGARPFILRKDGSRAYFDQARCDTVPYRSGVGSGYQLTYSGFDGLGDLTLLTRVWVEDTSGDVRFELIPLRDAPLAEIHWPAPVAHLAADGMTAVPMMQGSLLPNGWPRAVAMRGGHPANSRGLSMRFWSQYDNQGGYVAILETPYDGGLDLDCPGNAPVRAGARWLAHRGGVGEARVLRLAFLPPGSDYNDACKIYRQVIRADGALISLDEKIAANPRLAALIGRPLIHTHAWYHIEPSSQRYRPGDDAHNDRLVPFAVTAGKLRRLKALGVDAAALHLDGWGKRGYDNLHPDCLPPAEAAGGWAGMGHLADTCRQLGYFFGTHDQYHDYYFDAESFDVEQALRREDGSINEHAVWNGGRQTLLCESLALPYVRRNFDALARHGVRLDMTYLDVYSVVDLNECWHPAHPMTRRQCAQARMDCFHEVAARGLLVSSEEPVDWALPGISFCHHAPFALDADWYYGDAIGLPVPLFHLVYHDCVIAPWFPQYGGFGVQGGDHGALHSLLMGSGTYVDIDAGAEAIALCHRLCRWQALVQQREMTRHALVDGSPRRQRAEFAGGYAAQVDYDSGLCLLTIPGEDPEPIQIPPKEGTN